MRVPGLLARLRGVRKTSVEAAQQARGKDGAAVSLARLAARSVVERKRLEFASGGRAIRLDVHQSNSAAVGAPALLIYHGASGVRGRGDCLTQIADVAAAHGFTALVVHYFDRTATISANMGTVLRHSERWIETVSDAVSFATDKLGVDPRRIAVLGYSLGGFLAVAHSARDERVQANVIIAGGIDPFTIRRVKRLPATLVIHGENDDRVPPEKAAELCRVLEKVKAPHVVTYFPAEGHVLSARVTACAVRTAIDFLKRLT